METENKDEEKESQETKDKNSFSFYLPIVCSVIALIQGICLSLNIKLEINIIVDIVAFVFTTLIYFNVIKHTTKNYSEIKKQVEEELNDKMPNEEEKKK